MKYLFLLLMASSSLGAQSARKEYQVCTPEGSCALRLTDGNTGKMINVAERTDLSSSWSGDFFVVTAETYEYLKTKIPEQYTVFIPSTKTGNGVLRAVGAQDGTFFIGKSKYKASGTRYSK